MSDALFIDDGFTRSHHVPAVEGLYPAVEVEYRPALGRERNNYAVVLASQDADRIEKYETEVLGKYLLRLNGQGPEAWKGRLGRLNPAVRAQLLNVVLSYAAATRPPEEDLGNFASPPG